MRLRGVALFAIEWHTTSALKAFQPVSLVTLTTKPITAYRWSLISTLFKAWRIY